VEGTGKGNLSKDREGGVAKVKKKEIERLPVMGMEVTEVKIFPFDTSGIGGNVRAVANVKINGILEIRDIKIVASNNGYFIQMPFKRSRSGEYVPVVNPLSRDLYLHIRRKILDEFNRLMEKGYEKDCDGS